MAPTPVASQSSKSPASESQVPITPPAVPPITPSSKGHSERQLPSLQLPSKAAPALSVTGSVSGQARSRPTGLPLARKGSAAGQKPVGSLVPDRQAKGTEMSVSEMMQWLDSKLAGAVPTQAALTGQPAW